MRSARLGLMFSLLLFAIPVRAQSPPASSSGTSNTRGAPRWTPHPIRDSQAIQVVKTSISALGGVAAIGQAADYTIQAQVQQSPGVRTPNGTVTWTVAGGQYRSDFSTEQGTLTLSSGHGKPFSISDGSVTSVPISSIRALFAPALVGLALLTEIQTSNYSVVSEGNGTVSSAQVTIVKTSSQANASDAIVTQQIWYFNSATGFPVRVEFVLPDSRVGALRVRSSMDFSGYTVITGVSYPLQIVRTISFNSKQVSILNVTSVKTNTGVASSFFDAPAGGAQ
jgi:hypothetical protein